MIVTHKLDPCLGLGGADSVGRSLRRRVEGRRFNNGRTSRQQVTAQVNPRIDLELACPTLDRQIVGVADKGSRAKLTNLGVRAATGHAEELRTL